MFTTHNVDNKKIVSISLFCVVLMEKNGTGEKEILVVQDDPRKKIGGKNWESRKYKFPGGTITSPYNESFTELARSKLRDETGISAIFVGKLIMNERKPLHYVQFGDHLVLFYLMRYSGGEVVPGGKVETAKFISENEVKKMIEEGKFLSRHKEAFGEYLSLQS